MIITFYLYQEVIRGMASPLFGLWIFIFKQDFDLLTNKTLLIFVPKGIR